MQNKLNVFQNEKFGSVRTVVNENGDPFFCLADVCKCLDLSSTNKVKNRLNESGCITIDLAALNQTPGVEINKLGNTTATFISESNLYKCIMRSDKKEAEEFQDWVTEEVLPSIRKTGSYTRDNMSAAEFLLHQAQLMVEHERRLKNVEHRLDDIQEEREQNGMLLLQIDMSDAKPVKDITTKNKCREIVNRFCSAKNTKQQDVWHDVYNILYYQEGISVNNIKRHNGESKLEALERLGHIKKVYNVVCSVCR